MGGNASSPLYEETPLGRPSLRQDDLTSKSTRYDRARAAPSDEDLHRAWIVWSTFFFLFAIFNIIVFSGIVSSRKTRRKPFNLYVLFLMIPDIIYTLFCAVQCATLAANTGFVSPSRCHFQSFYLIFGLTANSWLNAVIASELHRLLSFCGRRRRYFPPSLRRVTFNSLMVYAYSAILAAMGCITFPWWPHQTDLQNGLVCLPMDFDVMSTILFWTVFLPLMSALPLMYCMWVAYDVWRKKLLPPSGKRREITIFFFRITGIFLLMWLPGIFIFYVLSGVSMWIIYAAPLWSHSQGAVASGIVMMRKDVYDAVMDLVWCRRCKCCPRDGNVDDVAIWNGRISESFNNSTPSDTVHSREESHVDDDDDNNDDDDSDTYSQCALKEDELDQNQLDIIKEDEGAEIEVEENGLG